MSLDSNSFVLKTENHELTMFNFFVKIKTHADSLKIVLADGSQTIFAVVRQILR